MNFVMSLLEFTYDSRKVLLNLKGTSVSLSVADREVYAFDLEGKPLSFWVNGTTFVWGLDCRVIKKWRVSGSEKQIQEVDPIERGTILGHARSRFTEIQAALRCDGVQFIGTDDYIGAAGVVEKWLAKFLEWNNARIEQRKREFDSIYSPVTILPPDQYLTVVLQVTLGCHLSLRRKRQRFASDIYDKKQCVLVS